MNSSRISVGLQLGTQPPLSATRAFLLGARAMRLDSVMLIDHFQNVFPTVIWDKELTWLAAQRPTPHEFFDYQALLGYLASRVGRMRLGLLRHSTSDRHRAFGAGRHDVPQLQCSSRMGRGPQLLAGG